MSGIIVHALVYMYIIMTLCALIIIIYKLYKIIVAICLWLVAMHTIFSQTHWFVIHVLSVIQVLLHYFSWVVIAEFLYASFVRGAVQVTESIARWNASKLHSPASPSYSYIWNASAKSL